MFSGLLVLHIHLPEAEAIVAATAAGVVTEGIPHLVEAEATAVGAEVAEAVN